MVDDDPIDDMQGVAMSAGTSLSRVAEIVIRHIQERRRLTKQQLESQAADFQARERAQRELADRHFARAQAPDFLDSADPRTIARTWHAAQEWKDRDPERFGAVADALNAQFLDRFGLDLNGAVEQGADRDLVADAAETRVAKVREMEQQERRQREAALEAERLIRDAEAKEAMARMAADRAERDRLMKEAEMHRQEAAARAREAAGAQEASPDPRSTDSTPQGDRSADDPPETPGQAREKGAGREGRAPYDSSESRAAREREMADAGVPDQARNARMKADQMNARNPREAASATARKTKAAGRTATAERSRETGRSR